MSNVRNLGAGEALHSGMTDTQIVWLRRDLRLADNPALYHAAQQGPVVAVFVLDDEVAKTHTYGGASRWWLHHSLADLGRRIEERGSRLILRRFPQRWQDDPRQPPLRTLVAQRGKGARREDRPSAL